MKLNGKENSKENRIGKSESHYLEAKGQYDSLVGNINRMFVGDDVDEIMKMYIYAKFRLNLIYHLCLKMYEERSKSDDNN